MRWVLPKRTGSMIVLLMTLMAPAASGATEDLGNGFQDHGVATPVSNHRGTVATIDGQGRNVVLVWLFDHRGGYASACSVYEHKRQSILIMHSLDCRAAYGDERRQQQGKTGKQQQCIR